MSGLSMGLYQVPSGAAKEAEPYPKKSKEDRRSAELAHSIASKFRQLYGLRGVWEQHWEEIAQQMIPGHIHSFNALSIRTPGQKRMQYVFDSTAILGINRFAAIMSSILTPPGKRWHSIEPEDPSLLRDREVREWCEEATNVLFRLRYDYRANFQSQFQMGYKSLGAFGSGCMFIDPRTERFGADGGFRYRNCHLGEVYFREDHQGIVDCIYRYFQMTALQAARRWPEYCPESIKLAAEKFPDTMFYFLHAVEPREDYDPRRKDGKGMPFQSCYIAMDQEVMLDEGGYEEFPYAVSRWEQFSGEVYGRGEGMNVLPATRMLNEEAKIHVKAGHRALDPPLFVHDDGVMQGLSLRNGAVNSGAVSASGQMLVHALPAGNLVAGDKLMERQEKVINASFMVDLFTVLTESPEMTATEVLDRIHQRGILLNPAFMRQQSDVQGPMIHRELGLAMRMGKLRPYPRRMLQAGGSYQAIYSAPVNRELMAEEAAAFERALQECGNIAQLMGQPQLPAQLFNLEVALPEIARIRGTPLRWINTEEQVAAAKAAAAEAMKQQQMVQAAPGAAAMIKAGAVAQRGAGAGNMPGRMPK